MYIEYEYRTRTEPDGDNPEERKTSKETVYVIMLFCFFWGLEVNKNIITCTVSATVASYWFEEAPGWHPVWRAFRWSCTYLLGGIAMGSAIVAAIETAIVVLEYIKRQQKNKIMKYVIACLQCLMNCVKKCAEYVTSYAYAFMGVHGWSFCYAGFQVFGAFPVVRTRAPRDAHPHPPQGL